MRAAKIVGRSAGKWAAVAFGVFFLAARVWADRLPLPAEEETAIKRAIDSGVRNLKKAQPLSGSWSPADDPHAAAYAALPGLALLECGVPKNDPVLLKAEAFVRKSLLTMDNTYDISLSILFLDRLGKKEDEKVIQGLALRLIAGQSATGGWGYTCPTPAPAAIHELLGVLHKIAPKPQPPKEDGAPTDSASNEPPLLGPVPTVVPSTLNGMTIMQDLSRLEMKDPDKDTPGALIYIHTDNSVTQFALVALWTAQRHDVPLDRTLRLIANRFQTSQNSDGSWGYSYVLGGAGEENAPRDCCGLLGLAVGHGMAHGGHESINAVQDKKIINGFAALNKFVHAPAGTTKDLPRPNLYFLWSLERVGVLYDLPTIAGKDWYQWGAEEIIASQSIDGVWAGDGGYTSSTPVANTSLALLFLARTNLVADLTASLHLNPDDLTKAIAAKVAPPPPVKTPEPPPVVTPPKAPEPAPVVKEPPPPVVAPPTPPTPAPAPKAEAGGSWLWIILGAVLVLVLLLAAGGIALFFILNREKKEPKGRKDGKRKKGDGKRLARPATAEGASGVKVKSAPDAAASSGVKTSAVKKSKPS